MDIPKQPIKTDLGLSPKIDQSLSPKNIITDIQDLKLEAGKVYAATVIQAKDTPPNMKEQTPNLLGEQTPNDSKTKTVATNEWLILVKGKTVLISSEKMLETGQRLLLKLEPSSSGEKPTLIAQLLNTRTALSSQNSIHPLYQAASSSHVSQSHQDHAATTQFDGANIKTLLQALNLTLDKQLPLQQGFQQLTAILNQAVSQPNTASHLKLVEVIKNSLIDHLPKLNEISKLNSHNKILASNIIKQSLLDSGVFLEKNLLTHPEKIIAFKQRLSSLEALLAPNQLPPKLDSSVAPPTNTTATKPVTSLQQSYGSAIQKIQQTIDQLLQLASNNSTTSSSTKISDSHSSLYSDLKANLLSTSSLLTKQLATELSDSQLKSIFLGGNSEFYSASPFTFPILPATNTSAASKILLDKQEFSTGQILKLLAGMIHKLQFNQLHSLLNSNNSDNPLQQTWFFELPVLNTNQSIQTFNFRIDKEPQNSKDEENKPEEQKFQWKLLLSFDLDMLGPIYVLVKLSQNTISSELWANKDSTYSLLQKESAYFKAQLEKIGLNVSEVLCKKGQPNQIKTKLDRHLVDTKV
jgi:hypothetical protein